MMAFRRNRMILMAAWAAVFFAPILAIAQVSWVKDFSAALKQAEKENKFIVLDVSASW
jgi:hypothetical protein